MPFVPLGQINMLSFRVKNEFNRICVSPSSEFALRTERAYTLPDYGQRKCIYLLSRILLFLLLSLRFLTPSEQGLVYLRQIPGFQPIELLFVYRNFSARALPLRGGCSKISSDVTCIVKLISITIAVIKCEFSNPLCMDICPVCSIPV